MTEQLEELQMAVSTDKVCTERLSRQRRQQFDASIYCILQGGGADLKTMT